MLFDVGRSDTDVGFSGEIALAWRVDFMAYAGDGHLETQGILQRLCGPPGDAGESLDGPGFVGEGECFVDED